MHNETLNNSTIMNSTICVEEISNSSSLAVVLISLGSGAFVLMVTIIIIFLRSRKRTLPAGNTFVNKILSQTIVSTIPQKDKLKSNQNFNQEDKLLSLSKNSKKLEEKSVILSSINQSSDYLNNQNGVIEQSTNNFKHSKFNREGSIRKKGISSFNPPRKESNESSKNISDLLRARVNSKNVSQRDPCDNFYGKFNDDKFIEFSRSHMPSFKSHKSIKSISPKKKNLPRMFTMK
jgi:hypothetical protein